LDSKFLSFVRDDPMQHVYQI